MNTNYDVVASLLNSLKAAQPALGPGAEKRQVDFWYSIAARALRKTAEEYSRRPNDVKPHLGELKSELVKGLGEIQKFTPELAEETFHGLAAILKKRMVLGLIGTAAVFAGLDAYLTIGSRAQATEQGENTNGQSPAGGATRKALDIATRLANQNGPKVYAVVSV